MDKLAKEVVLYYPAREVGTSEGTHCSACMMFFNGGKCTVVKGEVNGEHGVCGLYVHGEHIGPVMNGMTPKSVVGYVTNGPTHCENCRNFDSRSECRIVEGRVEAKGCCNAWEEGGEENYSEWYMRSRK